MPRGQSLFDLVKDEALGLQGRSAGFQRDTPLLGALPELDSMAVLALITGLENHFGITFSDEDLHGAVFATVGSLTDLVEQALKQGTVVEEKAPAARTKLPLAPKPRPLMARVNVPNSVFALGSMPILQRR